MTEQEAKAIILHDPHGNIKNRLEAIRVAVKVLGNDCTMSDIWRWAENGQKSDRPEDTSDTEE